MKITIDLNDPNIQKQIEVAIDAKIKELVTDRIQGVVEEILKKKTDRMTDEWLNKLTGSIIENKIRDSFMGSYGSPSTFREVLVVVTERVLREHLTK